MELEFQELWLLQLNRTMTKTELFLPSAIAPFVVDVIAANMKDEAQTALAEEIYGNLLDAGIENVSTTTETKEQRI